MALGNREGFEVGTKWSLEERKGNKNSNNTAHALGHWVLNLNMHQNSKNWVLCSEGLGQGLGMRILNNFPGDADAAGPGATLRRISVLEASVSSFSSQGSCSHTEHKPLVPSQ